MYVLDGWIARYLGIVADGLGALEVVGEVVVRVAVLISYGESHAQPARGTDLALEHAADSLATFLSQQPREHHGIGLGAPRCYLDHSRHVEHHHHGLVLGMEGVADLLYHLGLQLGEPVLRVCTAVCPLATAAAYRDDGCVVFLGAGCDVGIVNGDLGHRLVAQWVVGAARQRVGDYLAVALGHLGVGLYAHERKTFLQILGVGSLYVAGARAHGEEIVRCDAKHAHPLHR